MIKLSVLMLLVFSGLFAEASFNSQTVTNPQMRACRIANGQFFLVDTGLDQIGLCRLGPTIIGAADLLNKDADVEDAPSSVVDYKNGVTACNSNHIVSFPNPVGRALKACYYDDGSVIDLMTLARGKNSSLNQALNRALNLN